MHSDFYDILSQLPSDSVARWQRFRTFLLEHVSPIIDDYWNRGAFPKPVLEPFRSYLREEFAEEEYQFPPADPLIFRLMKLELGRVDPSMASFFAVHWGLAMGSVYMFGSDAQKQKWIPKMKVMEKIGSWALTEPLSGSDAAFGLRSTAVRTPEGWLLNGEKKWSGNASMADVIVVWAVEPESKKMLAFLLEPGMQGLHIDKIHDKIAKRAMENVVIRMEDVVLSEEQRLPNVENFRQVGEQLIHGRIAVAWEALGIAMGAFEAALAYTQERKQFGKPISGFQLVQEKLVNMLEEVTCIQSLLVQHNHTEEKKGFVRSSQASLAKRAACRSARKVCALAREVLGGNGILLEYGVARLFADMEAVYSYEGTDEMNTLIIGRSITGQNAFT